MRFRHRAGIPFLLLIVIWAALQQSAYADQVTLTYGDRISGRIISVNQDALRIQTPAFGIIQIERKYVEQISTDEPRVVDLVSGERVIGQLTAGEGKTVIIRSSILGERRIPLDTINVVQAAAESEDYQNVSGRHFPAANGKEWDTGSFGRDTRQRRWIRSSAGQAGGERSGGTAANSHRTETRRRGGHPEDLSAPVHGSIASRPG